LFLAGCALLPIDWPDTPGAATENERGGVWRSTRTGIARPEREDEEMDDRKDGMELIVAELRKTKETANRIANGDSPKGGADELRVVAGLVHQIAEQVERLSELIEKGSPRASGHTPAEKAAEKAS
jgi:hypothetical protein